MLVPGRNLTNYTDTGFTFTFTFTFLSGGVYPTRESLVVSSTQSVPLLGAIRRSSLRPLQNWVFFLSSFVLSMAVGSVLSRAIVSFPTINAFRKMADSISGLSKVVAEKCPERCPLKLSGLEIGELTQHLGNLGRRISRSYGKRGRGSQSSPFGRQKRSYPSGDTF